MMDVGLHDGGVDTQRLAILQPECDRRLHRRLIDGHKRLRPQPHERPLERIVLGHRLAVEFRGSAQRVAVGDQFAQFAIIPVLDAHPQQRAQHLRHAVNPLRPVSAFFRPRRRSPRIVSIISSWSSRKSAIA